MMIDHLLTSELGLQSTKPQAHLLLYLRILGVDVSDENESEVSGISKTCFVHFECLIQRSALQRLGVHQYQTIRVISSHHLNGVGEDILRVLVAVSQLRAHDAHQGLVGLLIATRSGEVEVCQLQHRLKILDRRRAVHSLHVLGDLRADRNGFAGQGFLQLRRIETTDTGDADDVGSQLCGRQIGCLHLRQATFREGLHQDLVCFELGRLDHHFDAVGEGPLGDTEFSIHAGLFDLPGTRGFLHQFGVDLLLFRCFDSQVSQAVERSEHLFFRRDVHPFFLRTGDGYGRIRMNERLRHLIDGLQRDHRQHHLHELILPFCTRHRLSIFEMTDTLTR